MASTNDDNPLFEGEDAYVPSPCVNVCVMDDASGLCLGCHRTIEEIMTWGILSAPQKRRVLEALAERERATSDDGTEE